MAVSSGIWILLLILRTISSVIADSGDVITPPNVILQEGEPGKLPCNYPQPASLLFWTKGITVSEAKVVLSSELSSTGELSGPGALEGRFNLSGFSLLILSVKREDEGRYFCEITDESTGEVFRSHTDVTIAKIPSVIAVSTLDAVELIKGQGGVLVCSFPQPVSAVYWKKGESRDDATDIIVLDRGYGQRSGPGYDSGKFDIMDDFSLVVHHVQKEDGGRYFCEVVSQGTGSRYDGFTDVTVRDPPAFYIDQCKIVSLIDESGFCSVDVVPYQEHISLNCSVTGAKGHISITWTTNDTASGILSSTSSSHDNVGNLTATVRVRVDNVPDGVSFTCIADMADMYTGGYTRQFTVIPVMPSSSASVQSDSFIPIVVGATLVVLIIIIASGMIFIFYRRHQDGHKEDELLQGQEDQFDESLPSWASRTDQRVRIRGKRGKYPPITILRRFEKIKDKYPKKVALAVKNSLHDENWQEWTYQEYWEECKKVAKGLLQLNVQRHETVGICGRNSPEWVMSYMGSIMVGCVAVGISTEFNEDEFWQVVDDCKPVVIVMEDTDEIKTFIESQGAREYPKHFVFYNARQEITTNDSSNYSWQTFIDIGRGVPDKDVRDRMEAQQPNECCSITYPNKLAGEFKGCMISHDNLTWLSQQCISALKIQPTKERLASYLPLHHVAFQLSDIMVSLSSAGTTYFMRYVNVHSEPMMAFVKLVRPTTFLFIPPVLDKIKEEVEKVEQNFSSVRLGVVKWSKRIGLTGTTSKWVSKPWGWTLANFLLFRKVRFMLGLNECKCCLSGANKLQTNTLDFFLGLGLPIYDFYGMCESTGFLTACLPGSVRLGSVGKTFHDSKIVIHNSDMAGNGEVSFYERNLFMGYLNQEERTKSSHTEQGLFLTGDIGYRDSDGFLFLAGKTRDTIKTEKEDCIYPGPVEEAIKKTPWISDCMLIGEQRPYLTLLATLKPVEPKKKRRNDETEAPLIKKTVSASIKPDLKRAIQDYNTSVATSMQQIKICFLLDEEFSVDAGEITKLVKKKNRKIIEENYKTKIDKMYETDVAARARQAGVQILRLDDQTAIAESET